MSVMAIFRQLRFRYAGIDEVRGIVQANLRIIGLASFLLVAFTRPVTAHLATSKRKQIESAVSTFMVRNNLPGVAVAVVENGNYEWAEGFGMADLENYDSSHDSHTFPAGVGLEANYCDCDHVAP